MCISKKSLFFPFISDIISKSSSNLRVLRTYSIIYLTILNDTFMISDISGVIEALIEYISEFL